ncbi:MAG: response regulator transcription factor [Actinobacteria bacterium]|nr:MAG: response regulator transcription factor [Actinomycetota bacterium]
MTQISVLIADDLPFLVDALRDLLEGDPSIVVVETANDAVAAVEAAATARPDVALLDVRMPAGGGGAAARGIRQVSPGTKIVALSAHFDHASVMEMVRAGAIGYVIKGTGPDEIIAAVHGSIRGESNLSPQVTGQIMQELGRSLARAAAEHGAGRAEPDEDRARADPGARAVHADHHDPGNRGHVVGRRRTAEQRRDARARGRRRASGREAPAARREHRCGGLARA